MLKHHRDTLRGIKALAEGIEVEVLRSNRHTVIRVSYQGRTKHLAVSNSPSVPDHTVRNAVTDVRRTFNILKEPKCVCTK